MSNAIVSMAAVAMAAVGATNIINRKRVTVWASAHDVFIVVVVVIVAAVLLALPAQAQDIGGSASSSTLYLPQAARNWHAWFTDAELSDAMWRTGYNPDVAGQHTVCYLDPSSVLPYDLRWSSCEQYYINGIGATEGTGHYILWRKYGNGIVTGVEVGG